MKPSSRRALVWAIALTLVFAALFAIGLIPRLSRAAQLESAARAGDAAAPVLVVLPHRAPAEVEISLPGNVQAYQFATIYARANGYVKRRLVDIGDEVKAGQLLAELETPELDEELRQARAALGQARAGLRQAQTNLELARVNLERSQNLRQRGIVPAQDNDDKQAAYDAQQAQVEAALANIVAGEANVERLTNLQSFRRVVAPFDGTITYRSIDPGALVTANTGASGRELFRIGQGETVRIFVDVPQAYATSLRPGQAARVTLQERPEREFHGKVVRTAGALDPSSRTLPTEIQVPNHDRALLAGMYADVKIRVTRATPPLIVPASALLVRNDGTHLAVVENGRVRLPAITLGRDYGSEIEVLDGLSDRDSIILNPSASIAEGDAVQAQRAGEEAARSVKPSHNSRTQALRSRPGGAETTVAGRWQGL
jgi:RND family efflux transporter MFP subunit